MDPLEADALFEKALAMWRGVPFASRLETFMAQRCPHRAGGRAACSGPRSQRRRPAAPGRHGELLPQFAAMASDHPLERLAGQLMLAQFRCGRQADALETFRAMRERLIEELEQRRRPGTAPGAPTDPRRRCRTSCSSTRTARFGHPRPRTGVPRRATSLSSDARTTSATVASALGEGPLVT